MTAADDPAAVTIDLEAKVAEAKARAEERGAAEVGLDVAHVPATSPAAPVPAGRRAVTMLDGYIDLAGRLNSTEFVPRGIRNNPPAVLAAMLTGLELGIGPMQSLAHIHIVDGKPTQSAELMRALILKAGHRFTVRAKSNEAVTVYGERADTGDGLEVTWSMADARTAGLANKGVWKSYPRAMLTARATSELARDLFADVLGGVSYTPEELGAEVIIDAEGREVIDYDATTTTTGRRAITAPAEPEPVDMAAEDVVTELLDRAHRLADADRDTFRDWLKSHRLVLAVDKLTAAGADKATRYLDGRGWAMPPEDGDTDPAESPESAADAPTPESPRDPATAATDEIRPASGESEATAPTDRVLAGLEPAELAEAIAAGDVDRPDPDSDACTYPACDAEVVTVDDADLLWCEAHRPM